MKLILPDSSYENSYKEYIEELGDEEKYPFPLDFEYQDFSKLLAQLFNFSKGINIPNGYVPSTTYWMVQDDTIIGVSNLRHYLNSQIKDIGGHIGLGIRPKYRSLGYGNMLLKLTLEKALLLGIDDVHVHCHKGNKASTRMILSCGAALDSEVTENHSGKIVQRYMYKKVSPLL